MNVQDFEIKLQDYMKDNSNLDLHRNYLGISKIAGCPRYAYDEFVNGVQPTDEIYRMCYAGYQHERSVLSMLGGDYVKPAPFDISAPFDDRFRGHVDAQTADGLAFVEVKSLSNHKYKKMIQNGKSIFAHYLQVQLYMRYGNKLSTFIIYRNRDTYEHKVFFIKYNLEMAEKYEEKAKTILAAIDEKSPPACTCGRCGIVSAGEPK